MCRNIRKLQPDRSPTDAELHDAALQFVRKISCYREPSQARRVAFEQAVREIAGSARRLFERLEGPVRANRTSS